MKILLDKYFEKTFGFFPFFKYCPRIYWDYYFNKRASLTLGYDYNPNNPRTLNEKIRWLIFNEKLDLKTKLTDKILVKSYVASKIGPNHTAELYGYYDDFRQIDFSILPNQFALKANHGWKMNLLVKNKNFINMNYNNLKKITQRWLQVNYEEYSCEPQYKNIKRRLFVEQLRDNELNRSDFQVLCFNGKALYIELNPVVDPSTKSIIRGEIYDTKWRPQDFTTSGFDTHSSVEAPAKLDEMIEYAEILSKDFSFVRVDFAHDRDNLHVVEMTFTPCSAIIPFSDKEIDIKLGEMLELPTKGGSDE